MFVSSTELLSTGNSYTDIDDAEARTLFTYFQNQGLTEFTMRFPSWAEYNLDAPTPTRITNITRLCNIASGYGLKVNIDFHTWNTTTGIFVDSASKAQYITYVKNGIIAMDSVPNVKAYMVMNEPPYWNLATADFQFMRDLVLAAKTVTAKPVSIRFQMPIDSSSHISDVALVDGVSDFLCRNEYWDVRYPDQQVYNTTKAVFDASIANMANYPTKEFWITEFGISNANTEDQRAYFEANIAYFRTVGISRCFAWCSEPSSAVTYNIFNGFTPYPAFYELANENGGTIMLPYHDNLTSLINWLTVNGTWSET